MKRNLSALISLFTLAGSHVANAQPVPKTVLAEHFTNSYCSVCASRNPGFYQNLAQFPQVLHIAYYPSSPYPACPINQYNKPEADARTNYYGVYGGTPRLVIQGAAIPASANYTSASLFQNEFGQTSPFALTIQLEQLSVASGQARVVIRKADTSALDSVSLYAALVEDTLNFAANNGETVHYDVFRRSVWGAQPLRVKSPVAVGDSVVLTQPIVIDAVWPLGHMRAVAIVQQQSGALLQAARSVSFAASGSTGVGAVSNEAIRIFPNPAVNSIQVAGLNGATGVATVYDLHGRLLSRQTLGGNAEVSVGPLPAGQYVLHVTAPAIDRRFLITRQ